MKQHKTVTVESDLIARTLENIVARKKGDSFSSVVSEGLEKWNEKVEKSRNTAWSAYSDQPPGNGSLKS